MSPWLSDLFLSSQSDERLISLARDGHVQAFSMIVARYRGPLSAFARRLDANGNAEDLVQQAFLNAFAALRSGVEVRHLRGWLYQILRNTVAASRGRAMAAQAELDESVAAPGSLEEAVEMRMLARDTLGEVARLPDRQRAAIVETTLHGRSRTEVARTMGLSEGAVRQLVHRARATVRTAVTALTPWPLARWFAGVRAASSPDGVEVALGTGMASASGLALKLGALIASGLVATGVIASRDGGPGPRHGRPHVTAVAVPPRLAARHALPIAVSSGVSGAVSPAAIHAGGPTASSGGPAAARGGPASGSSSPAQSSVVRNAQGHSSGGYSGGGYSGGGAGGYSGGGSGGGSGYSGGGSGYSGGGSGYSGGGSGYSGGGSGYSGGGGYSGGSGGGGGYTSGGHDGGSSGGDGGGTTTTYGGGGGGTTTTSGGSSGSGGHGGGSGSTTTTTSGTDGHGG